MIEITNVDWLHLTIASLLKNRDANDYVNVQCTVKFNKGSFKYALFIDPFWLSISHMACTSILVFNIYQGIQVVIYCQRLLRLKTYVTC